MKVWSRSLVASVVGLLFFGVVGCGNGTPGEEGAPASRSAVSGSNGLAKVDPCSILSSQDLATFGLQGPGETETMISSEPGCYYSGDAITATLYKNQEHTVESYEKTNDWDKYDRTEVSGRAAARAISAGNVDARLCSTILNAGSGVIIAQVHESDPGNIDECAKALEIAEKVEPNVPEPA